MKLRKFRFLILISAVILSLCAIQQITLAQTNTTPLGGNSGGTGSTPLGGTGSGSSGNGSGSGNTNNNSSKAISIDIPNPLHLNNCTVNGKRVSDIECIVNRITQALWILAWPIATLMILWAAFQYLTAGGDPEKASKARQTILYVVIGIVVLLFASSIVYVLEDIFSNPNSGSNTPSGISTLCAQDPQNPNCTGTAGD